MEAIKPETAEFPVTLPLDVHIETLLPNKQINDPLRNQRACLPAVSHLDRASFPSKKFLPDLLHLPKAEIKPVPENQKDSRGKHSAQTVTSLNEVGLYRDPRQSPFQA